MSHSRVDNESRKRPGNFLRYLGPGIITAALIFGPGSLIISSRLGSLYQYRQVWIILVSVFFMIIFTIMSAKYGLATRVSLIKNIRDRYGMIFSLLIGICITGVTLSFQTGNAIGSGLAIGGLMGHEPAPWILFFSGFAIVMLFFKSFYRILEKVMILMVLLMIVSFLITLFISTPKPGQIVSGFIPTVPAGSEILTIALVASSFSLVGAFFQSYLVQQKNWTPAESRICYREGITGIVILGFISMLVLTTAGSVLYDRGTEIRSAADLGLVLEPLFGRYAFAIFMTGMFAASFSSLLGNATLGGTILADLLGLQTNLRSWPVRILIMLVIATGAAVAILFRQFGIELIIMAQAFTVLLAPFVGLVIFLITGTRSVMGSLKNGAAFNILGSIGLALLFFLAVYYASDLIL